MTSTEPPKLRVDVRRGDTFAALTARVPTASELAPGTIVVVGGGAERGLFAKLFGKSTPVTRAVRASALLVRGYRDIEGHVDEASGDDVVTARA